MTIDEASRQPASPQGSLLVRYPLTSFFVMAFAFSWIVWSPWYLSEEGVGLLPFPVSSFPWIPLGILLGPTLAAFIMTGVTEGKVGVRRLLRRIVLWRVGFRWYLFALIGVPVVMALGTIILPGGPAPLLTLGPGYVLSYLGSFVLVTILGGPLFEEVGWRGFALPRMQPLHGPLVGSLILGLLWALWHLTEFWFRLGPRRRVAVASSTSSSSAASPSPWPSSSRGFSTTLKVACSWPSWCTHPSTPLVLPCSPFSLLPK
jgi:uncharacterized protein